MSHTSFLYRNSSSSLWRLWFGVTLSGALLGTVGISMARSTIENGDSDEPESKDSHSNGNGNVPWYYLTIYTIGIVFLSYYLGGVFNSNYQIGEAEENEPSATLLRLRTELKFLPISQFIRTQVRQNELRVVVPNANALREQAEEETATLSTKNIDGQTDVLVDAILQGYVFPWYNRISDEKTFPEHSKQILHFVFARLKERIKKINRKVLAKEVIQTIHYHWKEYCSASDKKVPTSEDLANKFTYTHPCVTNRDELSKHYESLLCLLLKTLVPPGMDYHVFCQFIAGILVKGVLMYYAEVMSDPKWVNTTLVTLVSSGTFANETSSNASGSNLSTAPPSPSPLLEVEMDQDSGKGALEQVTSPKDNEESQTSSEENLEIQSKQDTLLEVVATKGSIHNFLRLDSNRVLMENKKESKRLGMNSIQAALTGLLSATALPLLPDGSSYQLSKPSDYDEPSKDTEDMGLSETGSEGQPKAKTSLRLTQWEPEFVLDSGTSPTRHHSWEETLKQKSCSSRGKATKSLDDSKGSHAVSRQEEFDIPPDEPQDIPTERKMEASPMYDETEDFAATIAKLRSLLEQRQSRTNLMEENQTESVEAPEVFQPETTPTKKATALDPSTTALKTAVSKIRPSLNSQSSASSLTSDASSGSGSNFSHGSLDTDRLDPIEDNEEESEPVISRFFLNVVVNKTESCGDAAGQFTLYCIQYEGVYIDGESEDSLPKLVLRTTTVKRSFKEFLLLQGQLEDSPIWRPHLRGIKLPSKWLNLSFPNQNSGNQRRILLERYLQQICSHSILGFCPEVRHFMAYGDDGFQIFGLPTSNSIPIHRFDKLTKTFTGVLNSLRDALPSFESDLHANNVQNVEMGGKATCTDVKSRKLMPSFFQFGEKISCEDGKLDTESFQSMKGSEITDDDETLILSRSDEDPVPKEINDELSPLDNGNAGFSTATNSEFVVDGKSVISYPMALAMTQLLCDVLWLPQRRPHAASVSAFISISGKSLENYIQEALDTFLSEEAFLGYLDWITLCVTEWAESGTEVKQEKDEFSSTAEDLRRCFKQKIPVWVRWIWGRNQLEVTIERLVGFFQHSQLNHDHILSVIELIFSKLNDSTSEINTE